MEGVRAELVARLWRGRDPFDGFPPNLFELDMQGWGSHHPYLRDLAGETAPRIIVEVGVWKGASTIAMASQLRDAEADGAVIAIDTWLGAWDHWCDDNWFEHLGWDHGYPTMSRKFMSNVVHEGLREFVVPLPLDSLNASVVLKHFSIRPDIIHLDGAHDYEAVIADLRAWWPLLQPGGLLIGDDYYEHTHWPGVKKAFDEYFPPEWGTRLQNFQGKCRVRKEASQ